MLLVAAALACATWLAVSLRNEQLIAASSSALASPNADDAAILADLRRASRLNASPQPRLLEAVLEMRQGRRSRAVSGLRAILADEPLNRPVWLLLSKWLRPIDPRGADAALARYQELDGRP